MVDSLAPVSTRQISLQVSFVLQSIGTFLLAESILAAPLTPRAEAIITRDSKAASLAPRAEAIITRDSKAAPLAPRAEAIITRDSNKYLVGRADADTPSIEIQAGEEGKN
ncbi:hypothetical protein KXX35_005974 [Aspergillus fumigatus]|nr:hypothetical protein KXX60_004113 [Aspergillus fumigatus]KAH1770556.1 hypothetical protein KXX20_004965 [Aspergillus fumigatus]KAH1812004.1 hypothetical protein KXX35_005974 [Aspergillus fumigatus]KAH1862845.1 hypothetical protein KXW95_002596 [Aspergillus fumigatus]KAH2150764.1 hypothetical protein KXW33_003342 [Aspergillus fumigatus]